ncbi:PRA1 family protein F3-like [Chenopodium quinoa]|uniref:PRA1 family protein F3-like n=1 Tax=Chenopodium quinoa TaxID=63459 RepID=UPI000B79A2F8|nr:PRA1 family protein F3-like [Chenopodium quinoa]
MSSQPSGDYAAAATTQPWPSFFDIHSLSIPVSLSDATTRLNSNLAHFKLNYLNIFLIILFLTLALRPLSLLLVFLSAVAWYYFFFSSSRTSPLEILGFVVDDRIIVAVLSVITIIAFVVAHAWMNLLLSIVISAVLVCLHGVLRVPVGDSDPYGGLLDAESGSYSEF